MIKSVLNNHEVTMIHIKGFILQIKIPIFLIMERIGGEFTLYIDQYMLNFFWPTLQNNISIRKDFKFF